MLFAERIQRASTKLSQRFLPNESNELLRNGANASLLRRSLIAYNRELHAHRVIEP
jgi:hypothetical protein